MPSRRARGSRRGWGPRSQPRDSLDPLRISSRMASRPASNALMRRCVCSSKISRLLSSHSPARPCASLANSCARRATSPPRSARSSRACAPVFGVIRSANPAPSTAPNKNHPMYPPASLRSLLMVISLMPEAMNEYVDALLETCRHADDLAGAGQAAERHDDPTEPGRDVLHPVRHGDDALELTPRLTREPAHVLGERQRLADQRPQLLLDDCQHRLGPLRHPPERPDRSDERQQQRKRRQREEHLDPEWHGLELLVENRPEVNETRTLMSHQDRFDELHRRHAEAELAGGEERIRRQHKAGKKTARERLEILLDAGSFSEIMGPCAGGAVYSPALTDFILMVKNTSYMFVTGPDVIRAVTHEAVSAEDLGGARTHSTTSGVAHFAADSEEECLALIRELMSFLPQNNLEEPPRRPTRD